MWPTFQHSTAQWRHHLGKSGWPRPEFLILSRLLVKCGGLGQDQLRVDMGSRESTEGVKRPKLREKELLSSKKKTFFLKSLNCCWVSADLVISAAIMAGFLPAAPTEAIRFYLVSSFDLKGPQLRLGRRSTSSSTGSTPTMCAPTRSSRVESRER